MQGQVSVAVHIRTSSKGPVHLHLLFEGLHWQNGPVSVGGATAGQSLPSTTGLGGWFGQNTIYNTCDSCDSLCLY